MIPFYLEQWNLKMHDIKKYEAMADIEVIVSVLYYLDPEHVGRKLIHCWLVMSLYYVIDEITN
jgi:hypothetical protein